MRSPSTWSLAVRQLAVVTTSLILAASLLGIGGGLYISGYTERNADRMLGASVHAIGETIALEHGQLTLDVPTSTFETIQGIGRDNVYYAVSAGKRHITGYENLATPDTSELTGEQPHYRYSTYLGQPVRIAAQARRLPRARDIVIVQVAETLNERRSEFSQMVLGLAALETVLILIAALLIGPAVRWGLAPLTSLRSEIMSREPSQRGYEPLGIDGVPAELRGLVHAFNRLLGRLEGAASIVRQFTADASHQMRTPLAALKTYMALVRLQDPSTKHWFAALDEADVAIERLERLLSQLLGLARAEDEASSPLAHRADISLSQIAADVARELVPAAIAAGVDVRFENQTDHLIHCDPLIISEILANLIDNAIRYNGRNGTIIVRTLSDGGRPAVEVEDDGPGIPADLHDAVFRRFFRLDRDQEVNGSGLGLPIVRSLAKVCGADIALSPGPHGKGLVARLIFGNSLPAVGQREYQPH